MTKPQDRVDFPFKDEVLVASGEQSFLSLSMDLSPGMYIGGTPCFRDENPVSRLHRQYFMKTELFVNLDHISEYVLKNVVALALRFFNFEVPANVVTTTEGYDICFREIELGSYGIRKIYNKSYIFGTACAEPRLSYCIEKAREPLR